jgi:hypothetical protein
MTESVESKNKRSRRERFEAKSYFAETGSLILGRF